MCCNCWTNFCIFYLIKDNSKKPVFALVVAVLIFVFPFIIYFIVVTFEDLEEYDNHIVGQCEWNGESSGYQDCKTANKGAPDGYKTNYYYTSDECDYTLSYETECLNDAPPGRHKDGTCYILKCDGESNTKMTWSSQQDIELIIIICFIALFVDIFLLAYHAIAYRYYKGILDKRKAQEEATNNGTIQASWDRESDIRMDEF